MKISKEAVEQTVVTISEEELSAIHKDAAMRIIDEFNDPEVKMILTVITAKYSALITHKIFNNKEDK